MEFALFLAGGLWVLASRIAAGHSANGIATTFQLGMYESSLAAAFFLFLLLIGFAAIHWIATRRSTSGGVNGLPSRPTSGREWGLGVALGWTLVVLTILPMALLGDLHPSFSFHAGNFGIMLLSLVVLLLVSLTQEVVFRGYLYMRLISAIGPVTATLLMSVIYAAVSAFHPQSTRLSVLIAFLLSLLFSAAFNRTHALWLPWGLHFAWSASTGVIFGLPVGGSNVYSSIVDTNAYGSELMTGGLYGPEGALLTAVVVLVGIPILYRLTRDFAWEYTHTPIISAGYSMDVAPPPAHVAMEQAAAKATPLVQILTATPSAPSTMPIIDEHLRSRGDSE